jgi:predicted nucleotidyltransferase
MSLKERFGASVSTRLKKLIVFGSRARGDAEEDSDLDVVALVNERDPDIERRLEEIAYSFMWDHDFRPIVSLKVFSESQFAAALRRGFSFYRHVLNEGVAV